MNIQVLAWIAGFIEGDGTFGLVNVPRIRVVQKNIAPLELLKLVADGHILEERDIHAWVLRGEKAARLMIDIYPFMFSRRKEQIRKILKEYKKVDVEVIYSGELGKNWLLTEKTPSKVAFSWIAGFLEAEGYFGLSSRTNPCITVEQVEWEPLEYLMDTFGGSIKGFMLRENRPNKQAIHRWYLGSSKAEELMKAIYPMMSPKRQSQIDSALQL